MALQLPNDSEIASADWTPWLTKAPVIIQKIGFCLALASTKEASQVQISRRDFMYDDLPSNLVAIANRGQNAFVESYSDMIQIGFKTNNMGKIGGTLDKILKQPHNVRNRERLLNQLQTEVAACDENGKRTEINFRQWRDDVQALLEAVNQSQARTVKKVGDTEARANRLTANIAQHHINLRVAEAGAARDQARYAKALKDHGFLNSKLLTAGTFLSYGLLSFQTCGTIVPGLVVGLGIKEIVSAASSKRIECANWILNYQRKYVRELNDQLKEVEAMLEKFKISKAGLNTLLGAIRMRMNAVLDGLVKEHDTQLRAIANDVAEAMILGDDFEAFVESAKSMRKMALTVNALSMLYAHVIEEVINPGFTTVIDMSLYDGGDSAAAVASKQGGLQEYLSNAETRCRLLSVEARKNLLQRLQELDAEPGPAPIQLDMPGSFPMDSSAAPVGT